MAKYFYYIYLCINFLYLNFNFCKTIHGCSFLKRNYETDKRNFIRLSAHVEIRMTLGQCVLQLSNSFFNFKCTDVLTHTCIKIRQTSINDKSFLSSNDRFVSRRSVRLVFFTLTR